jgi:tetratricopeptide (TPR) repeat protein
VNAIVALVSVCFWVFLSGGVLAAAESAFHYNEQGASFLERREPEAAITEFLRAVGLDAKFFPARLNLAYAYEKAGRIEAAIEAYQQALEIQPRSTIAHNNLGVLYDGQGLYDLAIAQFEVVLTIEPGNSLALRNLEVAKKNQSIVHDRRTRLQRVEQEARAKPTDPDVLYVVARTYAFYGHKGPALEWLSRAREHGYRDFAYVKIDPAFESLRNDPAFQRLADPYPQ